MGCTWGCRNCCACVPCCSLWRDTPSQRACACRTLIIEGFTKHWWHILRFKCMPCVYMHLTKTTSRGRNEGSCHIWVCLAKQKRASMHVSVSCLTASQTCHFTALSHQKRGRRDTAKIYRKFSYIEKGRKNARRALKASSRLDAILCFT